MAQMVRACALLAAIAVAEPAVAAPSARRSFNRGLKAFKGGEPERAQELFAEARRLAPEWALPHLYWAICETSGDPDSDAGRESLERAARLEPDNPRINYYLGLAYERRERWPEAGAAFARALELRPGLRDASFHLGLAMDATQRYTDALAAYREAIEKDPNHAGALAALAVLYERFERYDEAEAALRRIARLQPSVVYHRYRLVRFFERIGEPEKAARARAKAELIAPPERKMRPLKPSRR